ncbi:hypothetical protein [Swinepox virus]|uniref:Uncharacterized protein n=1 Tax=Swinepox virus TaxID=10276 RepID=A0A881SXT7_SWPV|nr:hypothetical protein [Swinepox virus]QQG31641.1 hypothetical protein [Swinepox virus]
MCALSTCVRNVFSGIWGFVRGIIVYIVKFIGFIIYFLKSFFQLLIDNVARIFMLFIFYVDRLLNVIITGIYNMIMFPMKKFIAFLFGNFNPFNDHDIVTKKDDDMMMICDIYKDKDKDKDKDNNNNDIKSSNKTDMNTYTDPDPYDFQRVLNFITIPNPFRKYTEMYKSCSK